MFTIALAAAAALLTVPASADPDTAPNLSRMTMGYSYFNRTGADFTAHDRDLIECLNDAASVQSVDEQLGGGAGMGILGAMIGGALADAANRGVMAASIENCMVVHGWRVVLVPDAEGQAMSILPGPEIRAKLAPWIGAAEPHGTIARVWTNEAARGSINHFALRPDHIKRGQLSLLAAEGIDPKRAAQGAAAPPPVNGNVKLDPKWPKRAVKPENFGTIPAGSALVIFDLRGVNFHQGNGFLVSRVGPDLNTPPSTIDHATDSLYVIQGALSGGKTLAFAVPPGRWRIAAQINGAITLNYCLGAPEFEVKEGEVVFAGVLDMKAEDLTPDLSLDRVKLWMAGTAAAEKVRPAVYINGSRGACGPNTIFALEFKGAPYMPGYALGGAIGSAP